MGGAVWVLISTLWSAVGVGAEAGEICGVANGPPPAGAAVAMVGAA